MTPAFVAKLGFFIWSIGIGKQKIDSFALNIYSIIIARFLIKDKRRKIRFFVETFLLADTSMDIVLGMSFLTLSNVEIAFDIESFTWKSYSAAEALPTTR